MTPQAITNPIHWPDKPGQPGFSILRDESSKLFFFLLNDPSGKILLSSKGELTIGKCESKLNELIRLIQSGGHPVPKYDGKLFYFLVLNHQDEPIARSRFFDTKEAQEGGIQYLIDQINEVSLVKKSMVPQPSPQIPMKEPSSSYEEPAKYSFRVDFYPTEDRMMLRGKIEYTRTREKMAFKGIDESTILAFMKKYLPKIKEQKDPDLNKAAMIKEIETMQQELMDSLKLNFLENHQATTKKSFAHDAHLQLEIDMEKAHARLLYQVEVHSLTKQSKEQVLNDMGQTNQVGKLILPIDLSQMGNSIIRLIVRVKLLEKDEMSKPLYAERMLQV